MMVAASDRRAVTYAGLLCETLSILLIALAIIAPVPLWAHVFTVTAISYIATIRATGIAEADLKKSEVLQNIWHSQLTLRLGLDAMLEQVQAGKKPVFIDWCSASAAAADDIKSARDDEKLRDDLAGSLGIELVLTAVFLIGWLIVRVALGWALGFGILLAFPALA